MYDSGCRGFLTQWRRRSAGIATLIGGELQRLGAVRAQKARERSNIPADR